MTEFRKTRRDKLLLRVSYLDSPLKIICRKHQRSRSTYDYLDSSTCLVLSKKNRKRSSRNSIRNGDALSPYQRRGRSHHLWIHHSILNVENSIRTPWNHSRRFLVTFEYLDQHSKFNKGDAIRFGLIPAGCLLKCKEVIHSKLLSDWIQRDCNFP